MGTNNFPEVFDREGFFSAEQELLRCTSRSPCGLAGRGSPSSSGSSGQVLTVSCGFFSLFICVKPPSGQDWDWLHVGGSPGSNSCSAVPGRCLPVIGCLSRDRHRVKFLFWTHQSSSCSVLPSEQPDSEPVYPSRLDQHICVCFLSCPSLKKSVVTLISST